MDAGPETRKAFAAAIKGAKTILWKDRGTYKVLRLDFSGIPCETKENFEKAAVMKFFGSATDAGLLEAVSTPESFPSIAFLMEAICRKSKDNSVVLLVDEYDSPLCAADVIFLNFILSVLSV